MVEGVAGQVQRAVLLVEGHKSVWYVLGSCAEAKLDQDPGL